MNIHEFQGKEVLRGYGVAVPKGAAAETPEEVERLAKEMGPVCVVKAQIHAGGRGKAGGVKVCKSPAEAKEFAAKLLGSTLVTHQTGPAGRVVRRVLVEEGCDIARELYLGMVIDRATSRPTLMASSEGGVEIEEVAAHSPEKILREVVDPAIGLQAFQARKIGFALGLGKESLGKFVKFADALYRAFIDCDGSMAEINPLVVTASGDLLALDAKMGFDDNAIFRQAKIAALRDIHEEDPKEVEASKYDLSYISLDGNIGCMVNGAGLAMSTMDIIKHYGGAPANFLDVGGGASKEKVTAAFKIILADPNVKGVLVNIFGGIMQCDVLAQGVVDAAREVELKVPLVVRLEGTNVERGKEILAASSIDVITARDMADAAEKIVAAVAAA